MENRMGREPIPKLMLKMSFPMMMSMLVQALYNVVDSRFVARISEDALTGVSLAFPMQMLMIAVAGGTSTGVNSLISRRLGSRNQLEADLAATNGLLLSAANAIAFLVFGLLGVRPLMHLFTNDPTLHEYASTYLEICMVFSFGSLFQIMQERIILSTGNTLKPMLSQMLGAVLNIILDPILIFGYFGLPAMGVAGAAVATVIGQICGMVLGMFLVKSTPGIHIRLRGFRPSGPIIREIYRVGFPSIIMQAIGSVTTSAMNLILIAFTPTAVAVLGVYFKLQSFVYMPVFGLTSGALPLIAYNFGARDPKRTMAAYRYSLFYALIVMLLGMAVFQLIPDRLLLIFEASEHMLSIGVPALRAISLCFPCAAMGIMTSTVFQAVGRGFYSMVISLCRQILIIIPAAYLYAVFIGLDAVWYAYLTSEIIAVAMSALLLLRCYRRDIRPIAETGESE